MVKRYNPHSSIDVSAWIIEAPGGSVVMASDYDILAEQYASYREAASASIGASLDEALLERAQKLEALLKRIDTALDQTSPVLWKSLKAEIK